MKRLISVRRVKPLVCTVDYNKRFAEKPSQYASQKLMYIGRIEKFWEDSFKYLVVFLNCAWFTFVYFGLLYWTFVCSSGKKIKATQRCANCGEPIFDRFLLLALDQYWHVNCLKCSCCDAKLEEVGQTCFTKDGMILCKKDYLR